MAAGEAKKRTRLGKKMKKKEADKLAAVAAAVAALVDDKPAEKPKGFAKVATPAKKPAKKPTEPVSKPVAKLKVQKGIPPPPSVDTTTKEKLMEMFTSPVVEAPPEAAPVLDTETIAAAVKQVRSELPRATLKECEAAVKFCNGDVGAAFLAVLAENDSAWTAEDEAKAKPIKEAAAMDLHDTKPAAKFVRITPEEDKEAPPSTVSAFSKKQVKEMVQAPEVEAPPILDTETIAAAVKQVRSELPRATLKECEAAVKFCNGDVGAAYLAVLAENDNAWTMEDEAKAKPVATPPSDLEPLVPSSMTMLTYAASVAKAGLSHANSMLLTPAALASKAGLSLVAASPLKEGHSSVVLARCGPGVVDCSQPEAEVADAFHAYVTLMTDAKKEAAAMAEMAVAMAKEAEEKEAAILAAEEAAARAIAEEAAAKAAAEENRRRLQAAEEAAAKAAAEEAAAKAAAEEAAVKAAAEEAARLAEEDAAGAAKLAEEVRARLAAAAEKEAAEEAVAKAAAEEAEEGARAAAAEKAEADAQAAEEAAALAAFKAKVEAEEAEEAEAAEAEEEAEAEEVAFMSEEDKAWAAVAEKQAAAREAKAQAEKAEAMVAEKEAVVAENEAVEAARLAEEEAAAANAAAMAREAARKAALAAAATRSMKPIGLFEPVQSHWHGNAVDVVTPRMLGRASPAASAAAIEAKKAADEAAAEKHAAEKAAADAAMATRVAAQNRARDAAKRAAMMQPRSAAAHWHGNGVVID